MARQSGVNINTVHGYWKDNRRYPRGDHLVRIAQVLDTTAEYLIDGIEPPKQIEDPIIKEVVDIMNDLDHEGRIQLLAIIRDYSDRYLKPHHKKEKHA